MQVLEGTSPLKIKCKKNEFLREKKSLFAKEIKRIKIFFSRKIGKTRLISIVSKPIKIALILLLNLGLKLY